MPKESDPMRALVTGVSGFVGGHLAEHLVTEGDLVVGISASGRWPAEMAQGRNARIERFDLIDAGEDELAELLRKKQPEVIYHLAAQSNPQQSVADPRGTWALNLGGSLNLLEAVKASGLKPRVILVGSGTSYGEPARSSSRSARIAPCGPTTLTRRARPRPTCWGSSITWATARTS